MASPDEILAYWFGSEPTTDRAELEANMRRWYRGGDSVTREIREQFADDVERALDGDYDDWAREPRTRLALILLLDQFTRSLFANTPRAFAGDDRARALSSEAVDAEWHRALPLEQRLFYLMPLMHAESVAALERCIAETESLVADAPEPLRPLFAVSTSQAKKYRDVVARFGRFPHRNRAMGRTSTVEEQEFLDTWQQAPSETK